MDFLRSLLVVVLLPTALFFCTACGSSDDSEGASIKCRSRALTACEVDSQCVLGSAYAVDPQTLCVQGPPEKIVCDRGADIDGPTSTPALDPTGGLWLISEDDLPDGWSYPTEPIELESCSEDT